MNFILTLIMLGVAMGQIARVQIGDGIALHVIDILSFILFLYVIPRMHTLKKRILYVPLLSFLVIALLSLALNTTWLEGKALIVSALYLIRFLILTSIYFYISTAEKGTREYVIKLLIVIGSLSVILGYIQFFFYPNLRNLYYLGWDDHLYRLFGTFLDPNFTGAFYTLYCIFLSGVLLLPKPPIQKRYLISLLFISLLAIFFTYSRSAFSMLIVASIVFFILQKKYVIVVAAVTLLIALFLLFSNSTFENRNPLRSASVFARVESIMDGFTIISKNPIFGSGFNSYRFAQNKYETRSGPDWVRSHADAGVDNSLVFITATTGVIGLISFLYLLYTLLKTSHIRLKNPYNLIVFVSLIALIVNAQFINSLFYPFILVWVWSIVGLMEST